MKSLAKLLVGLLCFLMLLVDCEGSMGDPTDSTRMILKILRKVKRLMPETAAEKSNRERTCPKNADETGDRKPAITDVHNKTSRQCAEDIELMYGHMWATHNRTLVPHWQHQLGDTAGHIPSGLTEGYVVWSGYYDECVALRIKRQIFVPTKVPAKSHIKGKYCLGNIGFVLKTPLRIGSCIPDSCLDIEAQMYLNKGKILFRNFLTDESCQTDDPRPWDSLGTSMWLLYFFLGILVITGTLYDVYLKLGDWNKRRHGYHGKLEKSSETPQLGTSQELTLAFSALRNTKKILDTTPSKDSFSLGCIQGLKAISMAMILAGHVFTSLNLVPAWKNHIAAREFYQIYWVKFIEGSVFSVDTFFTITGFALVIAAVKEAKLRGNKFNPLMLYMHRLIRLWPAYAVLIAYMVAISSKSFRGPFIPVSEAQQEGCRETWWKMLLFIQVYFTNKQGCLPHIWYLPCDIFFILFSPLFLFPMQRRRKLGSIILFIMLALSLIIPYAIIHRNNLVSYPSRTTTKKQWHRYIFEVYNVPWGRMHCFLVGVASAYFYLIKKDTFRLKKVYVVVVWLVMSWIMFETIFGTFPYSSGKKVMPDNMQAAYGALMKPMWAVTNCWMIFACATGYGGFLNNFLSWKGFIPISRLCYTMFLVHISVYHNFLHSRREPQMVDMSYVLYIVSAIFGVSLIFAWLMTIAIEAPAMQIEGILRRRPGMKGRKALSNGQPCITVEEGTLIEWEPQIRQAKKKA